MRQLRCGRQLAKNVFDGFAGAAFPASTTFRVPTRVKKLLVFRRFFVLY